MDELLSALLGRAVAVSGYPASADPPQVARVLHEFFVRKSFIATSSYRPYQY
jgi:hypothetical protein